MLLGSGNCHHAHAGGPSIPTGSTEQRLKDPLAAVATRQRRQPHANYQQRPTTIMMRSKLSGRRVTRHTWILRFIFFLFFFGVCCFCNLSRSF